MKVFVYGTLRQGDCRAGVLSGCECVSQRAWLEGFSLLNLGSFPGIVPGEGRVLGEVYEIDDDILSILDGIECYHYASPEASLYLRETVTVEDEGGERIEEVFTYVYNSRRARSRVIESGDWFEVRSGRTARASS